MWMLYGATGYTGTLTAELAKARGLTPVLAGRNYSKLAPLAERLGLELRVFDLDDPEHVRRELHGFRAVLHMAGPFRTTSAPLVDACLRTRSHYLDITGEFAVFEAIWPRHADAVQAGVVLLPGVGFDVVPTDCLAALLQRALPDATELELAFATLGTRPSPGTVNTWLDTLARQSLVRVQGAIVSEPLGARARQVPFPTGNRHAVAVPLADLSSAYRSTGIPSITTYLATPRPALPALRGLAALRPVFASARVERYLKRWVERAVTGPNASVRARSRAELWGEARNAAGQRTELTLTTGDPYAFTADAALRCLESVLSGRVAPGASSPAQALGGDFVSECAGVTLGPLEAPG
ncbi:MAG TPA: saccharopine dehydrogenase NADP-binding domain-containing protein [Polyangiaceae bacterium]